LTTIVGKTYGRLDSLLLGLVLTPAVVGEYEVALKLTIPAILVSNSIQQALFPKVSNLHSRGEDILADVTNAKRFASVLALPLFFGALALSERVVVTVYGPDYRGAAILFVGLALYRVIDTQTQIYTRTLEAVDRPGRIFRASGIALVVNIPLGYALIVEYGAVGVVAATVVAELLRYIVLVVATRRVIDIGIITGELPRQIIASGVMYVAVVTVRSAVGEWSWLVLLAVVGFGAAVYVVVLIVISRRLRVTARGILTDLTEEGLA
jgi:O-antigen/teichoic acid export membrane protein